MTIPADRDLSVQAQKRELTRQLIARAAATVMAERGFSATVDEIARTAGLSSRTVFRHFETHDAVLAAGVQAMLAALGGPIPDIARPDEDLDSWIDRLTLEAHRRHTEIMGRAFWDVCDIDAITSDELAQVCVARRVIRMQWMSFIVARTWSAAGGVGKPPNALFEMFALLFSPFARNGLAVDFDHTPERSAKLVAGTLKVLLRAAVESQEPAAEKRKRKSPRT